MTLEEKIRQIIEDEFNTFYPSRSVDKMVERIMELLAEKVEPVTEDPKSTQAAERWAHGDSCVDTHPGRTHKQWQTHVDAMNKGFTESRGGESYDPKTF